MNLSPSEILVILVVALMVFGPKRLPEVGRQVGGLMRELRRMQDSVRQELQTALDEEPAPAPTLPPKAPAEPDHTDVGPPPELAQAATEPEPTGDEPGPGTGGTFQ